VIGRGRVVFWWAVFEALVMERLGMMQMQILAEVLQSVYSSRYDNTKKGRQAWH
jgi:hypothetical protein